jgi:hypothetical protein
MSFVLDLRVAVYSLIGTPGLAIAVILTLALSIGGCDPSASAAQQKASANSMRRSATLSFSRIDDTSRRPTMSGELSKVRLYVMRFTYLFTAVVVGFSVWPEVIHQGRMIYAGKPWD